MNIEQLVRSREVRRYRHNFRSSLGPKALLHRLLVLAFLAAGLGSLDFAVLALELASRVFGLQNLLEKRAFPLLLGHPGTEELGWALDQSSDLAKLGHSLCGVVLAVMPLRVEYVPH
jgi:hypothetical protein